MPSESYHEPSEAAAVRPFAVAPDAPDPVPLLPASETDLQFFSRRAREESRAALRAACPQAAAVHRALAAAYAGLVKREIDVAAGLDALVREID